LLLSNAIVAFAPTFSVILIGRVLLGATIGSFWTVAGALGPRLKPGPQAGLATAIILSGVSLGTVAGVPAGALIGEFLGWRLAFAGSGALTLAVLIAVWFLVPVLPPESRRGLKDLASDIYDIKAELAPAPGELVIYKERASAFFGTPLIAHLQMMKIDSLIICGESTSGCVRASTVDAYSYGFHNVVVEECTYDRSPICHKVNLFDLHHKYADVMHIEDVLAHLDGLAQGRRVA